MKTNSEKSFYLFFLLFGFKEKNVPVELHIYEKGGHGFGLGVKDTNQFWTNDCIQ